MKEPAKRLSINTRPIILVLTGLGFLSVILIATIMAFAQNGGQNNYAGTVMQKDGTGVTISPSAGGMILAVVEEVDTQNKRITLFDVDKSEALVLSYTGGANITDKYGQVISMNQIEEGIMVDAAYDPIDYKLNSMNVSTKAWEYSKVNNLNVDNTDHVMKIASTKYKYTDDIFVFNGEDTVKVNDLAEQDVLTVWGYEETIWSITVTTGHGTVMLKDFKDYLGDTISIGYESMLQITEDFAVTVREGIFNLTVENGRYSATKSVTVVKDQITYVSLSDIGPVGLKQSDVTFEVSPEGADLYIDGKLADYTDPVELSYGEHAIIASLGGYTTYQGTIDIDTKSKQIKIDLPEATSDQTASATSTDIASGTSTGSAGTDSSTDADTGTDNNSAGDDNTHYSSEHQKVNLDNGDSLDSEHKIYIKAPSKASVYLDGDYMGTAPCKFDKIVGNHVLTFIKDGYETMSYTVDVSDDGLDAYFTFPSLVKSK
jgi:hypothetical protein